jgi:drug/metabolite transporter (DMT)-like permease
MLWLILSLVTAFFESLRDVANKTSSTLHNDYVITWSLNAFTALLLLPLALFLGTPTITPPFWNALLAGSFLNAIAFLYFIKAIRLSDLSKVAPLTTFTPLFLLLTSPILVGEFPSSRGLVGIFLIVSGAYLLNFAQRKSGYLQPLRALINERGARLMLLVAFLWSLTSNFDKIGVQNSSPLFWVTTVYAANALWLFPLMLLKCQGWRQQIQAKPLPLLAIGGFNAIAVACQMTALSLTLVAYVIAIKRTSALFNVLWGRFIFQETGLKQRLLGTTIMVLGVTVIAVS